MDPRTLSTLKNVLFDTENGNTGIPHLTRKIGSVKLCQTNHTKAFGLGRLQKAKYL